MEHEEYQRIWLLKTFYLVELIVSAFDCFISDVGDRLIAHAGWSQCQGNWLPQSFPQKGVNAGSRGQV